MTGSEEVSRLSLKNGYRGDAFPSLGRIMNSLDVYGRSGIKIGALPFGLHDTTAGSEIELQGAVVGRKSNVDLPITIEQSNYLSNIIRRVNAGDTAKKVMTDLEKFLNKNTENVWEHSWVRIPRSRLSSFADDVLKSDLRADKDDPFSGLRSDADKFLFTNHGEEFLRVPISYLIKLSLADVLGAQMVLPQLIHSTGRDLMRHFLNDNTSPESYSFHVVSSHSGNDLGQATAREMAKRFLLTHLLIQYANKKFSLTESGQKAMVYFSPHPPIRLQELNSCISDAFYRELFMNPCLSGWSKGEAKYEYMNLCHSVLSRSQLNALAKLREAGIINSNLIVIPKTYNISLANNGTHVSLGSKKLTSYLENKASGFSMVHEKYVGDLVIKIVEHFLPLFVGTYSAAPYRLDFTDMHAERVLGFLPHELDYTHLRMLWRRWKKKANIRICGRVLTPFGPEWLDKTIGLVFRLRGDFVSDFRIIDYLVSLMSTMQSPALDGTLYNTERMKKDLSDLGVFDTRMAVYLLYRLREHRAVGFSGFEGRHYSLFEDIIDDMGGAVNLQNLLTALAYKYMAQGSVTHAHIPDDPFVESERRQIFFGSAIGIPTFFIRADTGNLFLKRIIGKTARVRLSRRYPGYLRVYNIEYKRALLAVLKEDAADLIEMLQLAPTIDDLHKRLESPEIYATVGKLTRAILDSAGAKSPLGMKAHDFNAAAERFYRDELRQRQIKKALHLLAEDVEGIERSCQNYSHAMQRALHFTMRNQGTAQFLKSAGQGVMEETMGTDELLRLINLVIISICHDKHESQKASLTKSREEFDGSSVY